MCGICGILPLQPGAVPGMEADLSSMLGCLRHRGPDSQGAMVDRDVAIGFSRLAIVDPANGSQPMRGCRKDLVVACNGEVLNFDELRGELEARHEFRTRCDVEVIAHLYEEHGAAFVDRLEGQFAIALWDREARELLLVRDPFGICPMFYAVWADRLLFASEIKSILACPGFPKELDLAGLDQVMTFPGLVSPQTMFRRVRSLPPGTLLRATVDGVREHQYWDLEYPDRADLPPAPDRRAAAAELSALLPEAVRKCLLADVPVGVYVSGGIDSSAIGSLANREGGVEDFFSVGFSSTVYDETRFQELLASRTAARLHQSRLADGAVARGLFQAVYHAECPIRESYHSAALALSRSARERGVIVVLCGEGADELFAGYQSYRWDRFFELHPERRRPSASARGDSCEAELRERLWGDSSIGYEQDLAAIHDLKLSLLSAELRAGHDQFGVGRAPLVRSDRIRGRHRIHQRSYLDVKLRLGDHLLGDHGDRMALANSVEARFPFLDRGIARFAASVHPDLHFDGYREKSLLREAARGLVPEEIRTRQKFPFQAATSGDLLKAEPQLADLISPAKLRREGYFDAGHVERLFRQSQDPDFTVAGAVECDWLMIVLTFEIFLEKFGFSQ